MDVFSARGKQADFILFNMTVVSNMRRNSICTKYCVQVFLFILTVTFGTAVRADIPTTERDVLIALYNATDGDGWANTTNKWKTGGVFNAAGTECSWFGITCDAGSTTVTGISLSNNGLTGTIPASLGSLANLEDLSLAENSLTGAIPAELSNLSNLATLWLHYNKLTGPIPLPVLPGDLPNLIDLNLAANQLSGAIPASLGGLAKITYLTLNANKLSGVIPDNLLDPITLTGMDLRYNAVHSINSSLITDIILKHPKPDFINPIDFTESQTIDADGLVTTTIGVNEVDLMWNPVGYTSHDAVPHDGGYRIYMSSETPDVFAQIGSDVIGKATAGTTVTSLTECTTYRARVHSFTSPHTGEPIPAFPPIDDNNATEVESDGELDDTYGGSDYVINFKTYGCSAVPVINGGLLIPDQNIPESMTGVTSIVISATDADGDPLYFSITGSTFAISNAGVISVVGALDYETTKSYTETVTVSDGVNSSNANVTINVTNVNESAPVIDIGTTGPFDIAENTAPYVITTITASDSDGEDTKTFSLTGGSGLFSIDSSTGELSLTGTLDYESGTIFYELSVTVTDSGALTDTVVVTINVTNLNESAPVIDVGTTGPFDIAENTAPFVIATITASDADGVDTKTFSLTGGSGLFSIDSSTGELSLTGGLDYESGTIIYKLSVTVTDSGALTDTVVVTINVTNVNESAPTITGGTGPFDIAENTAPFVIATITASDADGVDTKTFSLIDGSGLFSINSSTGELSLTGALDYESGTIIYELSVTVTDSGVLTDTKVVTINVTNLNESAPVIDVGTTGPFNIAENTAPYVITTITASDSDGEDTKTFSLTGGSGLFSIDSSTGELSLTGALDYESGTIIYELSVTVTDSGALTDTKVVTINVTNVSDNAPVISIGAITIPSEDAEIGTNVVTISATDADGDVSFTYSMTGTAFAIGETSGVITVNEVLDFETTPNYSETVTVRDAAANESTILFVVSINNTNDSAPSLGAAVTDPAENAAIGLEVAQITASDPDGGTTFTYTITSGNDSGAFAISDSGVVTIASALDYETTNSYTLAVEVSDGANTASINITINVTDVDESTGTAAAGGGGGGGCSIRTDAEFDPTLLFWVCLSVVYLLRKRPVVLSKLAA